MKLSATLLTILALTLTAGFANASSITLTVLGADGKGDISGLPGQFVGYDFTYTNDTNYYALLDDSQIARRVEAGPVVQCLTEQGGAVLMRPLTVHASARAAAVSRRRTLHLEFSSMELPGGLAWSEQ